MPPGGAGPGPGLAGQLRAAAAGARILGVAGGDGTVSTPSAVTLVHGPGSLATAGKPGRRSPLPAPRGGA